MSHTLRSGSSGGRWQRHPVCWAKAEIHFVARFPPCVLRKVAGPLTRINRVVRRAVMPSSAFVNQNNRAILWCRFDWLPFVAHGCLHPLMCDSCAIQLAKTCRAALFGAVGVLAITSHAAEACSAVIGLVIILSFYPLVMSVVSAEASCPHRTGFVSRPQPPHLVNWTKEPRRDQSTTAIEPQYGHGVGAKSYCCAKLRLYRPL